MPQPPVETGEDLESTLYRVEPHEDGQRADAWLAQRSGLSRSRATQLIEQGLASRDGVPELRVSRKVRPGEEWELAVPHAVSLDLLAQDIPLTIVHEDPWVIVVEKAAGMVVHPAPGHPDQTLVNALLYHCPDLAGIGGVQRPGIVHRIDKDTSGLLVITRTDEAHQHLAAQFAAHTVERKYVALAVQLRGPGLASQGVIETGHQRHPHDRRRFVGDRGGRHAVTTYQVTGKFQDGACRVECVLRTGRTHQIRMHLAELGTPLLGDELYGGAAAENRLIQRQALHAATLGFSLPNGTRLRFESPLPADMDSALQRLQAGERWRR